MPASKTPSKKETKKNKPLSHKELLEQLSGLEVRLESSGKDEEKEDNKEDSKKDFEDIHDLNFNGIDFNSQLRHIFNSQKSSSATLPARRELETTVSSAPRISTFSRKGEEKSLDYSETKYDVNLYNESKYESKTPDYAGSSESGSQGVKDVEPRVSENNSRNGNTEGRN